MYSFLTGNTLQAGSKSIQNGLLYLAKQCKQDTTDEYPIGRNGRMVLKISTFVSSVTFIMNRS